MKLHDKEHDGLMHQFERTYPHLRADREKDIETQKMGYLYEDGETNELFKAYRRGYSFGLLIGRE